MTTGRCSARCKGAAGFSPRTQSRFNQALAKAPLGPSATCSVCQTVRLPFEFRCKQSFDCAAVLRVVRCDDREPQPGRARRPISSSQHRVRDAQAGSCSRREAAAGAALARWLVAPARIRQAGRRSAVHGGAQAWLRDAAAPRAVNRVQRNVCSSKPTYYSCEKSRPLCSRHNPSASSGAASPAASPKATASQLCPARRHEDSQLNERRRESRNSGTHLSGGRGASGTLHGGKRRSKRLRMTDPVNVWSAHSSSGSVCCVPATRRGHRPSPQHGRGDARRCATALRRCRPGRGWRAGRAASCPGSSRSSALRWPCPPGPAQQTQS